MLPKLPICIAKGFDVPLGVRFHPLSGPPLLVILFWPSLGCRRGRRGVGRMIVRQHQGQTVRQSGIYHEGLAGDKAVHGAEAGGML